MEQVEINQGEIKLNFNQAKSGKLSLSQLGLTNEDLVLENGLLRLVIHLDSIGEHKYFQVPTIEIAYVENEAETHWICDFNGETILDKTDHHGYSTILLLDRAKLTGLEHRHINTLVIHAEFPEAVHIKADKSFIQLFQ